MAVNPVRVARPLAARLSRRTRGFTLTELLTVVGLIALIAALLLPVVGRVRATAAAAGCLAHLRQLGTAWTMYMAENRGRLPEYVGHHDAEVQWKESWPGIMERQKAKVNDLRCPAADEPSPSSGRRGYGTAVHAWTGKYESPGQLKLNPQTYREGSYGYNGYLVAEMGAGAAGHKNYLSGLSKWATLPVLFDCAYADARPSNGQPSFPVRPPPDLSGQHVKPGDPEHWKFLLARHGRGINVYTADGSAAWVRLEDLYALSWKDGWAPYRLDLPIK